MSGQMNQIPSSGRLSVSARNMAASALGSVVPQVLTFILTPVLLLRLGTGMYGVQAIGTVAIGYFAIVDMGLDIAAVKYLSQYHALGDGESENRLLNAALQLYCVVGFVGLVLIFSSAGFLAAHLFNVPGAMRGVAALIIRITALGFLSNLVIVWGTTASNALQRLDVSTSLTGGVSCASAALGLATVLAGGGVVAYVAARVAVSWIGALLAILVVRRVLPGFRLQPHFHRDMQRRLLSVGSLCMVMRVTGMVSSVADKTLITRWLGATALTYYVVPSVVNVALTQTIGRLIAFLFPMASELASLKAHEALRAIIIKLSRFLAGVSTIVFIPLIILADRILLHWVGPAVSVPATPVFRLLLLAAYMNSFSIVVTNAVPGLGHFRVFTGYAVLRSTIFAVACLLLIGRLGIVGAGVASILAGIIDLTFVAFALNKYFRISARTILREAYVKPLLLAALLCLLALAARPLCVSLLSVIASTAGVGLLALASAIGIGIFGVPEMRALVGLSPRFLGLRALQSTLGPR